jgi:hypothetical protein
LYQNEKQMAMKNKLLTLGFSLLVGSAAFAQNDPDNNREDSIHIVIHENQNGTVRVLDTIVPVSQQQSLFTWMETQGWETPPPPPPPGSAPMRMQRVIIVDDDSASTVEHRMIFDKVQGDSGVMPPHPPHAPCKVVRVKTADGVIVTENIEGPEDAQDVIIIRTPLAPLPPLSPLSPLSPLPPLSPLAPLPPLPEEAMEVTITEKDTVINGEAHKVLVRTEPIILPPRPPAPPVPAGEKKPGELAKGGLLVYPNPASAVISVEFDVVGKEKTTLRVVDMNGKVVYSEVIVEDQSKHVKREINLEGKGKGAYTVEVQSADKVIAERVILQ